MLIRPLAFWRTSASAPPLEINGSESLAAFASNDPHTVSLATQTYASGDYLLFFFGTSSTITVTSAAGATDDTYAQIRRDSVTGSNLEIMEGTVGGGALDASISVDLSGNRPAVGGLITISGAAANASQPNIHGGTTGTSNDPSAPSVTTTVNNCLVFAVIHARGGHNLAVLDPALPSGWTHLFSAKTSAGNDPSGTTHSTAAVAYKTQVSAGATGAATWTDGLGDSVPWSGAQIAIAPL